MGKTMGVPRVVAGLLTGLLCVVLVSCSSEPPPAPPAPAPAPGPTVVPLDGWKLTLPVVGKKGNAASVEPAQLSPPWLTGDATGLTFWAPVAGATTENSDHARTELVNLTDFPAGSGPHSMTATVSVAQVPAASQDVIIGQIHGSDDINSVAFVMLHYKAGAVSAVVKEKQKGDASTDVPLLPDVPLGAPFDFGIRDDGNGTITFTAKYGDQVVTTGAPLPAAFEDATVRFQAGAYQQDEAPPGAVAGDDGARVVFHSLSTGS